MALHIEIIMGKNLY